MQRPYERVLERIKHLPTEPGCYIMKDSRGTVFYIGKAINLRARLKSYFNGTDSRQFVAFLEDILADIETIVVSNNSEALLLEQTLIKKHKPKFNILLKDDKNFISLRLAKALHEAPKGKTLKKHLQFPRLEIVRTQKNDGARYFGPYPSASQLRTTLHLINKHFQLRTCQDKVIDNRARPCIQHQIGRCLAPCVIDVPSYGEELENVQLFLSGHTKEIEQRLFRKMQRLSDAEHFELAAKVRDQIEAIKVSLTAQSVANANQKNNQDIIACARQGPFLAIVCLMVRKGLLLGQSHYHFDKQEFPTADLMLNFITQHYEKMPNENLPDEIALADIDLQETKALSENLSIRRQKNVRIYTPSRGKNKSLLEIAQKNVLQLLAEKLRDKAQHEDALLSLKRTLGLANIPLVIECFDISLFQGTDAVASKVSFKEGVADKSQYRKYTIKTVEGMDDFAMLYEAISRRLKKGIKEGDLPHLLLVDGGKGQLGVAMAACQDLAIDLAQEGMSLASIAKARVDKSTSSSKDVTHSEERLFVPGVKDPILLRHHTPERYLIERIRDEAHRFAITFHRSKRSKRTFKKSSALSLHATYIAVRHGESVPSSQKIVCGSLACGKDPKNALTEKGRVEVEKSTQDFIKKHHEKLQKLILEQRVLLIASPFSRTQETAQIIRRILEQTFHCSIQIQTEPELRERFFGDYEGKDSKHVYDYVWKEDARDPYQRKQHVESAASVQKRALKAITILDTQLASSPKEAFVFLVSHGDTLKILQTAFQGKNPSLHCHKDHVQPFKTAEFRIFSP